MYEMHYRIKRNTSHVHLAFVCLSDVSSTTIVTQMPIFKQGLDFDLER